MLQFMMSGEIMKGRCTGAYASLAFRSEPRSHTEGIDDIKTSSLTLSRCCNAAPLMKYVRRGDISLLCGVISSFFQASLGRDYLNIVACLGSDSLMSTRTYTRDLERTIKEDWDDKNVLVSYEVWS